MCYSVTKYVVKPKYVVKKIRNFFAQFSKIPTASNTTRLTTEISPVSVQQTQPINVTNIHQQKLRLDLLKQVPFMNKQLSLIKLNTIFQD